MEDKEEIKEWFCAFLREHSVYTEFINEFHKYRMRPGSNIKNIWSFLFTKTPSNWVDIGLSWMDTRRGYDFWWSMNGKWKNHLQRLQSEKTKKVKDDEY